jgi:hypothetical protein
VGDPRTPFSGTPAFLKQQFVRYANRKLLEPFDGLLRRQGMTYDLWV